MSGPFELKWPTTPIPSGPFFTEADYRRFSKPKSFLELLQEKDAELRAAAAAAAAATAAAAAAAKPPVPQPQPMQKPQQVQAPQPVCTQAATIATTVITADSPARYPRPDKIDKDASVSATGSTQDTENQPSLQNNETLADNTTLSSPEHKIVENSSVTTPDTTEIKARKYHQWVMEDDSKTKKPKGKRKGGGTAVEDGSGPGQKGGGQGKKIIFPRATLTQFFPRTSWFSEEEQKQYLEMYRKYYAHLPPNPTLQEIREIHSFKEMHVKVVREQEEFLCHLEASANKWYTDYTYIHPEISRYMEELLDRQKKRVTEYARYYVQLDSVTLIPPKICSNPSQLTHVKTLLETGKVPRAALPNMMKKPHPKVPPSYGKVSQKFPTTWPKKDKPVSSQDLNAQRLSQKYQANVVISSSGLTCLLDNHHNQLDRQWEMPVVIKEHTVIDDGEEKVHRVVYIDKPLPPKKMTVREKNARYHSLALKTLIQNPSHNSSYVFGQHCQDPENAATDDVEGVIHDDIFGDVVDVTELESFGSSPKRQTRFSECKSKEGESSQPTEVKVQPCKTVDDTEESMQQAVPSPEKPLLRAESEGFIVSTIDPDEESVSGCVENSEKSSQATAEANKERLLKAGRIASALRQTIGSPLMVMMGNKSPTEEPPYPPSSIDGKDDKAVTESMHNLSRFSLGDDLSEDSENEDLVIDTGDVELSPQKSRCTRASSRQQIETNEQNKDSKEADSEDIKSPKSDILTETCSEIKVDQSESDVVKKVEEESDVDVKNRCSRRTRSNACDTSVEKSSPVAKRRSVQLQPDTENKSCAKTEEAMEVESNDGDTVEKSCEEKNSSETPRRLSLRTRSRQSSISKDGSEKAPSSGVSAASSRASSPVTRSTVRTRRSLRSCKQEPVDESHLEIDENGKSDVLGTNADESPSRKTDEKEKSEMSAKLKEEMMEEEAATSGEGRVLRGGKRLKKQDESFSPAAKRQLRTTRSSSAASVADDIKADISLDAGGSTMEAETATPSSPDPKKEHDPEPTPDEDSPLSPEMGISPESPEMQCEEPASPTSPKHIPEFVDKPLRSIPLTSTSGYGCVIDSNVSDLPSPPRDNTYQSPPHTQKMMSPSHTVSEMTPLDSILQAQDVLEQLGKPEAELVMSSPVRVRPVSTGRSDEDEWESAEDPADFPVRPTEHNFTYNKWMLGDIPLLIRCSHHAQNRVKRKESYMLNLMPKLEYQAYLGVEQVTISETCRAWIRTYVRHNTKLYRARINLFNSDMIWTDELDISQIVHPQSSFSPPAALTVLHGIVDRLTKLPSGAYLLSHTPGNSHVHIKKSVETCRGVYDLHLAYSNQVGVEPSVTEGPVPWIPIDTSFVMPVHYRTGRIPATFIPPSLAKGKNAPKQTQKPSKKKNKGRKSQQTERRKQRKMESQGRQSAK